MSDCGDESDCGACGCQSGSRSPLRRPVAAVADPFPGAGDAGLPLRAVLRETRDVLTEAGVPSPATDTEILASRVLGLTRPALAGVSTISQSAAQAIGVAARRRAEREPLQHILGEAWFRYLDLHVGPGVFVPRPETEVVVDAALSRLPQDGPAVVVDLGAGSGAISIALATERPQTTVYAVELDAGAVPWLTQNVIRHAQTLRDQGSKIMVVLGDAGAISRPDQPLAELAGTVDLVVANPPYIPDDAQPRDPEVRDYDPKLALFGGPDGLDVVRRWLDTAADLLQPDAPLVMEHGDLQGDDSGVPGLIARHENVASGGAVWREVTDHLDLTGRPRYAVAIRSGV